ncbi:hypothetical protein SASPL_139436 [Salvia splendens]|uniref:Survival protein SurE-like phosphatase/nucleotidase domain-containing protein n=1 Tax=Salvia splendens TaxID=180675 RepID=A0A8X8WNH2_SALSN|nr:5'-nucleotidase SurE-like [Salvia splendens]KAG6397986.1 hypothetical protein SASPL_139436 [Salvia splendens]
MNNLLPPGLVSNLQQALANRKPGEDDAVSSKADDDSALPLPSEDEDSSKPVIFVTNSDGIESPGLSFLVNALVEEGAYNVNVIVPESDKSTSGHSVSLKETIEVASVQVKGATAYEISGTPVDCVSLALSGALFSWTKPLLVVSGISKGSSFGHHMYYSSVVAGAREALVYGVPAISISLNWQKDVSQESDFKDAVTVCLPIIKAAMRDIENGVFPKGFSLDLELPTSPSANKGVKVTKRSHWRSNLNWQAISNTRAQAVARFTGAQPPMGLNIAQLSRDASAAGAARRLTTQKKDIEVVESVGVSPKAHFKKTVKYFRAEMLPKDNKEDGEDLDFKAVENGFVSLTPSYASVDSEADDAALNWIKSAVLEGQ